MNYRSNTRVRARKQSNIWFLGLFLDAGYYMKFDSSLRKVTTTRARESIAGDETEYDTYFDLEKLMGSSK